MAERKGKSDIRKTANARAAKKSSAKTARAKKGGASAEGRGLLMRSEELLKVGGKPADNGVPLFSPPGGCGGAGMEACFDCADGLAGVSADILADGNCGVGRTRPAPCGTAADKPDTVFELGRDAASEAAVSHFDFCGNEKSFAAETAFVPAPVSGKSGADILSAPGGIFAGSVGDKIEIPRELCEIAAGKTRGNGAVGCAASNGADAANVRDAGNAGMASSPSAAGDGGEARGFAGVSDASPVAQTASPRDFFGHLERIRRAKREADAIAGGGFPDAAQASLAIAWELVFDHLCGVSELTLAELNTLSGVIHKLSSSKIQLCAPEEADKARSGVGEICEESIRKIEEKLGLL